MSQTFPTSAQVIYETLSNYTEFVDLLGSYKFKGGQTATALSIVTPGEDLPSLRKVSGLECVIHDTGSTSQQPYYDEIDLVTTWSIFMISWEPSTGAELQSASEMISRRFLNANIVQVVSTTDGLGSLVQNKITIASNMPILGA